MFSKPLIVCYIYFDIPHILAYVKLYFLMHVFIGVFLCFEKFSRNFKYQSIPRRKNWEGKGGNK